MTSKKSKERFVRRVYSANYSDSKEDYDTFKTFYLDTKACYGWMDTPQHWRNAIQFWAEDKKISLQDAMERLLNCKECDYSDKESHKNEPPRELPCFGTTKDHIGARTLRQHFIDNNMRFNYLDVMTKL